MNDKTYPLIRRFQHKTAFNTTAKYYRPSKYNEYGKEPAGVYESERTITATTTLYQSPEIGLIVIVNTVGDSWETDDFYNFTNEDCETGTFGDIALCQRFIDESRLFAKLVEAEVPKPDIRSDAQVEAEYMAAHAEATEAF